MVSGTYYDILGIPQNASREELKQAYRRIAKRNHPDLFPETERKTRLARMSAINEAYRVIGIEMGLRESEIAFRKEKVPQGPSKQDTEKSQKSFGAGTFGAQGFASNAFAAAPPPAFDPFAPAMPKDPGYVYYKRGCVLFSQGRRALLQRYNGRRLDFTNLTADVLKLAVSSLGYFHKAHEHFRQVVERYPDSIWLRDSELKMYFLRRYDVIYRRICENMRQQLQPTDKQ